IFCGSLSTEQRAEFAARIRAQPGHFVAQEQFALSTVPVWQGGVVQSRQAGLRTYLVANGRSYDLMPGGLTQVLRDTDTRSFSPQHGAGSKDPWVQATGPVSNFSMLAQPGNSLAISRGGMDLPSRVADNLFWLGRYVERAESIVRLLRSVLNRLSDKSI